GAGRRGERNGAAHELWPGAQSSAEGKRLDVQTGDHGTCVLHEHTFSCQAERSFLPLGGQNQLEPRAARAPEVDEIAPVRPRIRAGDGEAKAGARAALAVRSPRELVEELRLQILGNARARVRHSHPDVPVRLFRRDDDWLLSVAKSVGDE